MSERAAAGRPCAGRRGNCRPRRAARWHQQARIYLSWKARRDSLGKTGAVQLAIFADSDRIDPIAPHSENSYDHFYAKDAKFFFVYVCASGFVAFSI
ncbi:hypothetical protein [Burkholderia ubonensis]|uniref:hypothetical protein n=1 Tax=Burkholderia ubonensis TaxID=101571 RepID=UPI0012F96569|nr:hypothetical protein [Burkholderia ubonensis]